MEIIIGIEKKNIKKEDIAYFYRAKTSSLLSENGVYFEFYEELTKTKILVYKNSKEGREVTRILNEKYSDDKIFNIEAICLLHSNLGMKEFRDLFGLEMGKELEGLAKQLLEYKELELQYKKEYENANDTLLTGRNKLTFDEYIDLHSRREWLYKELKHIEVKINSVEFMMRFLG